MNKKDLDALNELYLSVYDGEQLDEILGLPDFGPSQSQINQWGREGQAQRAKDRKDRATNQRAQLGVVKTNKGYVANNSTVYDAEKSSQAVGLADRLNKEGGLGRYKKTTPPEKKQLTGITPVSQQRQGTGGGSGGNGGGGAPPRPAPPKPSGPVLSKKDGVEGTGVGANFKARAFTAAEKSRYSSVAAQNAARTSASSAIPKPATEKSPQGYSVGTTAGGTKFERRTPTRQEMDAAKRAGGGEAGVKAAVASGQPTTGPANATVKPAGGTFAPRDMSKYPLKPAPTPTPTATPAPTRNGFGASTAGANAAASVSSATAPALPGQNSINNKKPIKEMSSYEWPSAKTIRDIAGAYASIYEAKKKVDQDEDGDNDFGDVRIARMIASGVPKAKAIAMVKDKSYNEEVEIDEATAMAKRGYDETEIRNKIAKSTGGGKFADKATALADRQTYGNKSKKEAREKLARKQRGDFRDTTSSNPGLHGYAYKSNDPAVKAKQAARGAQRGALTPNEKKELNREAYAAYEFVASYLLENNFANTVEDANVIINNMSENWFESIIEEKKPLPVAKMKNKESKLLDNEEGQLQALRTGVGSNERKARMKELQRFDNINSVRTSVAKRGGKQQHSMPEIGRFKPKDED